MLKAHKIRLCPNNKQESYLRKACGINRFAYNWAYNLKNLAVRSTERINACGDESSGLSNNTKTKLLSLKQEGGNSLRT